MMRMSRERLFHLTDLILKQLGTTQGVNIKAPDELRTEVLRALTEEAKLAESIDGEVRKILSTYSRPMPEGSHEWEVLYEKTREEVFREPCHSQTSHLAFSGIRVNTCFLPVSRFQLLRDLRSPQPDRRQRSCTSHNKSSSIHALSYSLLQGLKGQTLHCCH